MPCGSERVERMGMELDHGLAPLDIKTLNLRAPEILIRITFGTGEGPTELAAFDRALFDAGIANYNLLRLSSVIPMNSKIEIDRIDNYNYDEYGFKLYTVLSRRTESTPGKTATAGIGWVKNNTEGMGLFVEHTGESEEQVIHLINDSLSSMRTYRREELGEISFKISSIACIDRPVCALVAAVYKSEGWMSAA